MHKDDNVYNENIKLKSDFKILNEEMTLLKNQFEKVTHENDDLRNIQLDPHDMKSYNLENLSNNSFSSNILTN